MTSPCSTRNADRISYLPEGIQRHIVSFLPIEQALRTSILSKRWEHVRFSLLNMEFDESDFQQKTGNHHMCGFRDFVDGVILRHDGSDVRKFSLHPKYYECISPHFVSSCISFALRHNVQELDILGPGQELVFWVPRQLPLDFFTCSRLTSLELTRVSITCPAVANFPMLRLCYLYDVTFFGENTANKLFSNCTFPVLEELEMIDYHLNDETLSISIPSLKYFNIDGNNTTVVKVSGSTLCELDYDCCVPPDISPENLTSLRTAFFGIKWDFHSDEDITKYSGFNFACNTLSWLHNIVTLQFSSGFLEFLARDRDLLASFPSVSPATKHLSLSILPIRSQVGVAILLLRSYSHLETLSIYFEDIAESTSPRKVINEELYQQVKGLPPAEILNCLKTVNIDNVGHGDNEVHSRENEAHVMQYLLDNAKFLEAMDITTKKEVIGKTTEVSLGFIENELMTRAMSSLPRASPNLKISVVKCDYD